MHVMRQMGLVQSMEHVEFSVRKGGFLDGGLVRKHYSDIDHAQLLVSVNSWITCVSCMIMLCKYCSIRFFTCHRRFMSLLPS